MTRRSTSSIKRYVGLGALSFALVATPALVGRAEAMPMPGPDVSCIAAKDGPAVRRAPDTPHVSAATLARVERQVQEAAPSNARVAATLPTYRIKVQIHIIHGRHKRERAFKRKGARRLFHILQDAYNGSQSTVSERMGIVFDLTRITVTKNDRWFHAKPMSRADRQMKHRLHRGKSRTLNIYVNKLRGAPGYGPLLGFSRFPWQYRSHPSLDGVTVNVRSLPHGNAWGYNLGDTVVHETGHWLGLLHTFTGGCSGSNDGVVDTPAESEPNFSCVPPVLPSGESTVCDPTAMKLHGYVDPAFNFMDYSLDACMRMFTLGQHERVVSALRKFRFAG